LNFPILAVGGSEFTEIGNKLSMLLGDVDFQRIDVLFKL
jgi:hypothetical protein